MRHRWLLLAAIGVGVACFDGADAQGLPCVADEDCGLGQSCVDGFCGGPPDTSGADSSGSTSDGSTSTTAVDSTDTGGSSEESSGSTGIPEGCGNDVVDPGEDCDPGPAGESADCNSNCTAAVCGDGYTNVEAGEQCDDGDPSPYDGCTEDCYAALFFDDVTGDPAANWMMPTGIMGWVPQMDGWFSGNYSDQSGLATLTSQPFAFPMGPPPMGTVYQLRVRHRYRFDNNPQDNDPKVCDPATYSDGGMIFLQPANEPENAMPIGPTELEGINLDDAGDCAGLGDPLNPLFEDWDPPLAFSGFSDPGDVVRESIMNLPTEPMPPMMQVVFDVGYDCRNCWDTPPPGAGWFIDDVVLAPFPGMPPPPGG